MQKIKDFFNNLKDKLLAAIELINKIEDEDLIFKYKQAIALILKELWILIKHYKPRKLKGHLNFGLDDPANTATISGIYYFLYPKFLKKFDANFDYNNEVLEGKVKLTGRIRLNHLAYALWVLYKNETIKSWIKSKEE